jgi:phosphotransferase system HPr (HPr) family protein
VELRRTITVTNTEGLHARPCHSIVSAALSYKSELRIRSGNHEVNGRSILELMTLNASAGTELELCVRGNDAVELLAAIEALFTSGFGEFAS